MSTPTTPQLHIPFEFAESLVHQLQAAARETGRASLLQDAGHLQAEIDAQIRLAQPEH